MLSLRLWAGVRLVWPALGQADLAQHERLTPTSFDWLRMKRRNPGTGVLRARIDAARRDKQRVVPWIPTSVGMSGERVCLLPERALRADWIPAFAGDAAEGPLPV